MISRKEKIYIYDIGLPSFEPSLYSVDVVILSTSSVCHFHIYIKISEFSHPEYFYCKPVLIT
jgi:hypothetical protein